MQELVIIDYNSSEVHFYKIDSNTDIDYDYIESLGFNPNGCSWMFAEDIEVFNHKGILK